VLGGPLGVPIPDRVSKGSLARVPAVTAGVVGLLFPLSLICFAGPAMMWGVVFNGVFNLFVPGYLAGLRALVIGLTMPRARGFMISLLAIILTLIGYGLVSQIIGILSDLFRALGVQSAARRLSGQHSHPGLGGHPPHPDAAARALCLRSCRRGRPPFEQMYKGACADA
jgi:hypothetical protein